MRHLVFGALLFSAAMTSVVAAEPLIVSIDGGQVQGSVADGVASFRAIPYAAPPVGPLRWKPPQPVVPWIDVRDATKDGPICPQPPDRWGIFAAGTTQNEDCLTVNVFAPANATGAPVMVWLHGGGHSIGSGSQPGYDGSQFARRGVILVSVNYRLGPLGYFAHPALTAEAEPDAPLGAYGDMDQHAALLWVKANIRKFGGDPANVTLFGESAGGDSTLFLLANPQRSSGLVDKAIVESGGGWAPPSSLAAQQADGVRIAMAAGAPEQADAAALRALPADRLAQIPGIYRPFADGRFYVATPTAAFTAHQALKVPLVIGANTDEGALMMMNPRSGAALTQLIGSLDAARPVYGVADDQQLARLAFGDSLMVAPARYIARQVAAAGGRVWLYSFSYTPTSLRETNPSARGAIHGAEVAFVFGLASYATRPAKPDASDLAVAERMNACWAAFAHTSVPCQGDVAWPAYGADDSLMDFGQTATVQTHYRKAELDYQEQRVKSAGLPLN
jgi:para-nitrobenzyl esterase